MTIGGPPPTPAVPVLPTFDAEEAATKSYYGEGDSGSESELSTPGEELQYDVARRGTGGNARGQKEEATVAEKAPSQRPAMDRAKSYKEHESYAMSEDVYAFIVAAPVASVPFAFAIGVIFTKYIVFGALMLDIFQGGIAKIGGAERSALVVKALLVPVAIAMQSDLMAVYAGVANVRYDKAARKIAPDATKVKFGLSYLLQLIDGLASLGVNFCVMLQTPEVLGVLLNFAALHFLQDIDDIFYILVEKGFFGDSMEGMATKCKQISWPRRDDKSTISKIVTQLDTILFFVTFVFLFSAYLTTTIFSIYEHPRFYPEPS